MMQSPRLPLDTAVAARAAATAGGVSAWLLEVGGLLQLGAVVARDYGKPCVAGIGGVITRLQEGLRGEVAGSRGGVRLLE